MAKKPLLLLLLLLTSGLLYSANKKKPKVRGFYRAESKTNIVEVSNTLPKSVFTDVKKKVSLAEKFFHKTFKLPPGILTGAVSKNSKTFRKLLVEVQREASIRMPKSNWFKEIFNIEGKIHYRIWDTRKGFATEWFDNQRVPVPEKDRDKLGLPGAYFRVGHIGTTPEKGAPASRYIRGYVGNRDAKRVVSSLYHEMGHLYLMSYLLAFTRNAPPAWLNEGFAELFAYALPSDKKTKRKVLENKAVLHELVMTGEYWKFDTFFNVDNAHNLKMVADKSFKSQIMYTQAWSVVQFLTKSSKYSAKFLDFLGNLQIENVKTNLVKGKAQTFFKFQNKCFKQAFGADMSVLEKYWVKHVKKSYGTTLKRKPELNYYIGNFYLRRKLFDKAEVFYKKAAELAPKFCESHLGLGRLNFRKNQYKESSVHFENATKADPENEEALTWLGWAYLNSNENEKAYNTFKLAVEKEADGTDIYSGYGRASYVKKIFDNAALYYSKAYSASRDPRHLLGQGKAEYMMKSYTAARRSFSAASARMKGSGEISFWIGVASYHLGEKKYALSELKKSASIGSNVQRLAQQMAKELEAGRDLPEVPVY